MFTLSKESQMYASIPSQGGFSNNIHVWQAGKVQDAKARLDIAHPLVGELVVKLAAPSGRKAVLLPGGGSFVDRLNVVIKGDMLRAFVGEEAKGLWNLTIDDPTGLNCGKINVWGLDLACKEFDEVYRSEICIPRQGSDLLTSVQQCRFSGRVIAAEAEVEIEHPLVGDLVVSLVSPKGTEVVLLDREGGSQQQVKRHFGGIVMVPFLGEETLGAWTLKVKNFHLTDNGMLRHWKVKFRYEAAPVA